MRSTTNGASIRDSPDNPIYRTWRAVLRRCRDHPEYAGRGVRVCPAGRDFATFRAWALAHSFEDGLTIDRLDGDGDYCPQNCRWATRGQQSRNRRDNRLL